MPNTRIVARPWQPQDLIDDLQGIIDEECDNYLNTRRTTLCMARDYLKEYFAEQKWIPVTERLPDLELVDAKANDRDVYPCLCVVKHQRARGGRYVTKLFYDGENFMDRDMCLWTFETTHWMPLPEPPKGEE